MARFVIDGNVVLGEHLVQVAKARGAVTCKFEEGIGDAIDRMRRLRVDALVVVAPSGVSTGILASFDLLPSRRRPRGNGCRRISRSSALP